ncbi:hypothetical protein Acr_17g0005400 [Actinidia rufa]|uniref:Uncharacterized protein n=1 Tax=Actinidia rufa TaxID=165716 RepID=A0A7J0G2H9_9ERIC|nr:hypothetical protein Acr_17g0005400 [Actinidia rufa]
MKATEVRERSSRGAISIWRFICVGPLPELFSSSVHFQGNSSLSEVIRKATGNPDVFQSILNQLLKIQNLWTKVQAETQATKFSGFDSSKESGIFLKLRSSDSWPEACMYEGSLYAELSLYLFEASIWNSGSGILYNTYTLLGHIFVEDSKPVLYLINASWKMGKEKHRSKTGVAPKPANTVVTETGVQRRNGQGGHGTSPFIAMALPPNSSENGGLIAKYVTEEYSESLEDIPEVESNDMAPSLVEVSEGAELEEESVSASRTLGDEDSASTQGVCQNANKIQGTDPKETVGLVEAKGRSGPTQGAGKQSYASLFENNRRPSLGSHLDQIETGDGPIPIEAEEVQDTWNPWKHCLVGYFGGRFPDGEIIEQPIFYENLPRFCKHCKLMGHSDAGCVANKNKPKNKQVEANKTAEVSNVVQLEQGTSVTDHQIKRGKAEWVQVQNKTTNNQSGGRNAKPTINLEPGNKFVALTAILDNVDVQPQAQEVGSVQIQSIPEKQKTKIGEGQETNQIKQGNPLTGQSEGRNNVLNGVQIQISRSSLDQTQHNFNRSRGQVGGAGTSSS